MRACLLGGLLLAAALPAQEPQLGAVVRELVRAAPAAVASAAEPAAEARALLRAGEPAAALAVLAAEREAPVHDLFLRARCHEELHTRALGEARDARRAEVAAEARARAEGAIADRMRDRGDHDRAGGGTLHSVAEHDRHRAAQRAALEEAARAAQSAAAAQERAAAHFTRASALYRRVEVRDVRTGDGGRPAPGRLARAASAAREMLRWVDAQRDWHPPEPSR